MEGLDLIIQGDDNLLSAIAEKIKNNQRIDPQEGLYLYEKADLGTVGTMANYIREKRHGDLTYFNRNFHLEPTNICLYTCSFCSYSRLIKKREEGWEYTHEDMMEMIKKYDDQPVTEVHIVGGVLPQYDVAFYTKLFKAIKQHRPCLLYTSPSPRDQRGSRMPSSA